MGDQGQGGPRGLEGQTPFPQPGNKQGPGHKTPGEFDFFEKRQGQRGAALPFKTLMWRKDLNWGSPACGNRVRTYRGKPCPNADGIVSAAVMHGWVGPGGQSFIPATRPTVTAVATERFNALMRPREDAPARQPPRSHKLTQRDTICHNPRHRKPDRQAQVPARLQERALSEGASAGTFFQEGIVGMKNVLPGTQTACAPGHALEGLRR